ncbi:DNRLRE domain-containing protein [Dyadobacter sp. NIV53]|uniref:CBM96 family carbohydrate-binding protein n=1 Tax=Dyadobacter sp. NIV53 TaxID=2861765 RepID=UPI001C87C36A|nr:DNRLRE domain-containing protein [Dyadobacter sp. NIV53]
MKNITFSVTFPVDFLKGAFRTLTFFFLAYGACFAQNGSAVKTARTAANPVFQPVPPLCYGASAERAIFFENFESGLGAWTVSNVGYPDEPAWLPRDWVVTDTIPAGRTGKAAFAVDFASEDCGDSYGPGLMRLTSPAITIPGNSIGPFTLSFEHFFDLESNIDGGNLKYQINNGDWKLLPASAFINNGYIMNMMTEFSYNSLFTEPAFTNPDVKSTGSGWGQSRVDLTALGLQAGQAIRLRWEIGTEEGCGSALQGWYVDDVRVYTCSVAPTVQFALDSTIVSEGEANIARPAPDGCIRYAEKNVTVRINAAPSQPVTVTMTTAGMAKRGSAADYSITPASFTLQAGKLSQDIKVRINNDPHAEGNETIILGYTLSSPAGGDAFRENYNQQHTVLIADDDFIPGIRNTVLFSEGFNQYRLAYSGPRSGPQLPPGWSGSANEDSVYRWRLNGSQWYYDMGDNTPFLCIFGDQVEFIVKNPQEKTSDTLEKTVEGPVFDSFGMSAITLAYNENLDGIMDNGGHIDVWDGSRWQTIHTVSGSTVPGAPRYKSFRRQVSIPARYASRNMKLRFRLKAFYSDGWAFFGGWSIDNILVTGTIISEAASAITTDTQYLGPNATAYFYDPASEKLIAKIKNLSSHDYGCTAVSIDRAGANETDWFNPYHITKKTFKVTPANDAAEGQYEMTLYYKGTELPVFNGTNIKSMGRSQGGIGTGNLPSTSVAEAVISWALNSSYGFSAVFGGGFSGTSGFGLSDAPAVRPVALRINSGGDYFMGSQNHLYLKDQYYDGSTHTSVTDNDIAGSTDDELYRNQLWGPAFSYRIPVQNGKMQVVLHFAEIYWGVAGRGGPAGAGKRRFHVNIEGSRKLTDYDIYSKTGGALRAGTETFTITVTDGMLDIDFLSGAADNPIIAAIEVVATEAKLEPVADAMVRNIPNESVNYGTAGTLEVKAGSLPSYQRKTYLKFPLAGITQVGSARLRLYGSNIQNSTGVSVSAYGVDNSDWTETGISWANAPAGSGSALGSVNVNNTARYYEIDVTSFVQSHLTGDGTVSFLLTNATSQNSLLSFNSRENTANPPELVILQTAAPAARSGIQDDKVVADDGPVSTLVYPNPASKQLTVEVSVLHRGKVNLCLTGLSGNSYPVNAVGEENILRADLSPLHLPPGIYILNIHSAVQDEAVKLLITE